MEFTINLTQSNLTRLKNGWKKVIQYDIEHNIGGPTLKADRAMLDKIMKGFTKVTKETKNV